MIRERASEFRENPSDLLREGYWFPVLEDKIAGYLLSADQNAPASEIFCCETDVMKLYKCLEEKVLREISRFTSAALSQTVVPAPSAASPIPMSVIDMPVLGVYERPFNGIRGDAINLRAQFHQSEIIVSSDCVVAWMSNGFNDGPDLHSCIR